jgi:uncharacterized protein (TIGR00730 family)
MIQNIAVFLCVRRWVDPAYRCCGELGRALAERATSAWCMAAPRWADAGGGRGRAGCGRPRVGVIPTVLVDLEVAHDGLTELHVTDTMHTRKALIGERSDAFIALPGGFGTFEECSRCWRGRR